MIYLLPPLLLSPFAWMLYRIMTTQPTRREEVEIDAPPIGVRILDAQR